MQLKALTAILTIAVFATGFVSVGHAKALSQTSTTNPHNTVKVASGDTLSSIARDQHTTYVRLFDANPKVSDPNLIFPGEDIRIPAADEQLPNRLKPVTPASQTASAATSISRPGANQASPRQASAPAVSATAASGVWNELAQCESGGNWSANTGNGFYGGLQFTLSSWYAAGGSGYPNQASASEQIVRAEILQAREGWGAWPACSAKLGLR